MSFFGRQGVSNIVSDGIERVSVHLLPALATYLYYGFFQRLTV
ncbi:hypothetical protein [Candidatus Symbiopectobacterium sp. 'North America']|nr:hypothetical protein [Candidatus Symbiopectobacterium sp. 'North America']